MEKKIALLYIVLAFGLFFQSIMNVNVQLSFDEWQKINSFRMTYEKQVEEEIEQKEVVVKEFGTFKSYMDYKAITNKRSTQYKLQQFASTDENGLRRIDDLYMIATGSYYGLVGDIYKVTLENGLVFEAVKGDAKSDKHTDSENKVCLHNGSVIEFIVDTEALHSDVKRSGSVSSIGFEGSIVRLEKVGEYELE